MKYYIQKRKAACKAIADVFTWSIITPFVFLLRFDLNFSGLPNNIIEITGVLFIFKAALVIIMGSHKRSWRNTTYSDFFHLVAMNIALTIPYFAVVLFKGDEWGIPRSIPLLESMLAFLLMVSLRGGTRFGFKYRVPYMSAGNKERARRILIAGAGESGMMVAKEMLKNKETNMQPVAFVDDEDAKLNTKQAGIKVMGTIDDMPQIARKMNVDEIIIAMPSESGDTIRRVVEIADKTKVNYRIIPGIYDLVSGKISINQIRDVDVQDLLRRKPIKLETDNTRAYLEGKRVLVTGAGGSIGSEIVRQVARFNPKHIILMGRGENSIAKIVREVSQTMPDLDYCIRICDVRDEHSLNKIFENDKPEVVFHAAAHKHVPLMEENPAQAIFNNVMGTRNLVRAALKNHISHFVNISTDKAVNPTSVMGASKRIAEHIVEWGASLAQKDEHFVSVRFGNVLGSRGSVIPIFKDQIKKGGPVTVTHPDMIRYFMTIPEASQLVLQAGALNHNGAVHVLDMGDPVNIEQMARDLIRLSGLEPDKDIEIKYTGMRPGEKLFEELLTSEEGTDMTQHEKIFLARKTAVLDGIEDKLDLLVEAAFSNNQEEIRKAIYKVVPTYLGYKKDNEVTV